MKSNQVNYESAHFQRISEDQCQRLFWACLEILERTGVLLHDPQAIELLRGAGVSPSEDGRVRIPAGLVERCLTTAPPRFSFYNRSGDKALLVEGYNSYFGPGSDCLYVIDHRTNQRRRATMDDIREAMTLVDALPNIDFAMCMFLPEDVPQESVDRYQMEWMLKNTEKPIVFVTTGFSGCVDAIEMAETTAGGEEAFQRRPSALCYVNVTTGLNHNQEALQKLLYLSKKGIPFAYVPSTQGGVTAPVTPAGSLAVSQAGALVGVVLSQLQREGTPILLPGWGGNMLDMRTTVQPYSDPDKRALAADYVHWLGLPMFALAGCSDSKSVDQQAAAEAALTLMSDVLCGGNLVHDLGYLESGLTGSLVQLALCDEILGWLSHFVRGVEVSEETLALDLVEEVGPEGQFLDSDHTFKHYKERWYPGLFNRDNYDGWMAAGGKSFQERAAERVQEILENHQPKPLSPDQVEGIERIRARAG